MATKTIKFKIINNLQTNDVITYQIWRTNGTRITYANGIQLPTLRMATVNSPINNIQLGATKEQTMLNIFTALTAFNYTYTGLSYTYNGTDEITISITNADGFEHRINQINVPNNIIVLTETACSTVYLYNLSIPYGAASPFIVKKDGVTYSTAAYPTQFEAEVPRNASYNFTIPGETWTLTTNIPRGLTSSDVSDTLNNNNALININQFNYFSYINYYFNLNDGPWQTTRDIYGLLPNTTNNIDIMDKWGCKLDYPIVTTSLDFGFIAYPQFFVPVYNPIYYKFSLANFDETGFRYLINLTNEITGEQIANFNIIPDIDGTGYIDVSKYLSNFTTVDFSIYPFADKFRDCENSYIKYEISLGYEVNEAWTYLSYTASLVNGINYTQLVQNDQITPNTFATNDQITVTTLNGLTAPLNGLHTVLSATPYSVTIDVPFPGTSSSPISGSVRYSDNRKTKYNDVYVLQNNYAWNGALDWKTYKNYNNEDYFIVSGSDNPDVYLLTSLKPYTVDSNPVYYITENQYFYLNFAFDNLDDSIGLYIKDNLNNENITYDGNNNLSYVNQFCINLAEIWAADFPGNIDKNCEWIEFNLINRFAKTISLKYRLYVDRRCAIEDYEILFMDRLGSIQSFAFPLRAKERGKIERDMFNKYIDILSGSSVTPEITNTTLDLKEAGKTIYNVDLTKEIELNTNWMTDDMSVLFEELLTSPYTWIREEFGVYYPCIIKESTFEVERQKNKNLIRKTITVEYSNKNAINI